MDYPYVATPDKLKEYLRRLPDIGVPPTAGTAFVKSLGFKSSNHKRFPSVTRFLGIVDGGFKPTDKWSLLRSDFRPGMASILREAYSSLFQQFPDAQRKDAEALKNFFSANSTVGAGAVSQMVGTFRAMCELADFDNALASNDDADEIIEEIETGAVKLKGSARASNAGRAGDGLTVNINVQLQLPSDASGEVYDKFFEAMRKHLLEETK